jgi:hypothetical protein
MVTFNEYINRVNKSFTDTRIKRKVGIFFKKDNRI